MHHLYSRFPHIEWRPLFDEGDRRRAYEQCDLVVVPRKVPGGLPIKLLDALGRDLPVVAQNRALCGLRPSGVVSVPDDCPQALRNAIKHALFNPPRGGRQWILEHFQEARFCQRFEEMIRTFLRAGWRNQGSGREPHS